MTKEDILKAFPDATKEQIDAILNKHSEDIGKVKNSAAKPKIPDDYEELKEKAKKLKELEDSQLSEQEKVQKALEEAQLLKSKAQRSLNEIKAKAVFIAAGFSNEDAEKLVANVLDEDEQKTIDSANSLAELFKQREESVTQKVKTELFKNDPKPQSSGGQDPSQQPASKAEEVAIKIAEKSAETASASQSSREFYFGGKK